MEKQPLKPWQVIKSEVLKSSSSSGPIPPACKGFPKNECIVAEAIFDAEQAEHFAVIHDSDSSR